MGLCLPFFLRQLKRRPYNPMSLDMGYTFLHILPLEAIDNIYALEGAVLRNHQILFELSPDENTPPEKDLLTQNS
jgi:hypothetical protein